MAGGGDVLRYVMTIPERTVRAAFASVGGTVHETAQIVLPRFVRGSRFYEATAKNALRIAVELVGGVARDERQPVEADSAGRVAVKKTAGNFVEIGSIAAFGFSPLWLLAGASDVLHGSRVYLRALEGELAGAGLLEPGVHFSSVDQLIGALEGTTGTTARAIDLPPLELSEMKRSLTELRGDVTALPSPGEMMDLFHGLIALARHEDRSLLEVSSGVGLAFVTSARNIGRDHLVTPYREDWSPLRTEGFAGYATRIARPYRQAVLGHFDRERVTVTERLPGFGWRAAGWVWQKVRRPKT